MSVEQVRQYLTGFGLAGRIREFDVSSATVDLAAQAVGVKPERIAKTLAFEKGETCFLVVTAGDAKIDNTKFKAAFKMKASMLNPDDALRLTGHAVGGVCPFALPPGVSVYLDVSMKRFETVFPAAGSAASAVEMTCVELFHASRAQEWVDVCKSWEPAN